jgi:hypothetical protein
MGGPKELHIRKNYTLSRRRMAFASTSTHDPVLKRSSVRLPVRGAAFGSLVPKDGPALIVLRPTAIDDVSKSVGLKEEARLLAAPAAAAVGDDRNGLLAACAEARAE